MEGGSVRSAMGEWRECEGRVVQSIPGAKSSIGEARGGGLEV